MAGLFVKKAHCGGLMGHFGVAKTLDILMEKFFWPKMRHDVERICGQCLQCKQAKFTSKPQGQYISDVVGSPYYVALEVLHNFYGPEIYVWSAGVILYILDFESEPWPHISDSAKDLVKEMLTGILKHE